VRAPIHGTGGRYWVAMEKKRRGRERARPAHPRYCSSCDCREN
jgi:hypothetical protein